MQRKKYKKVPLKGSVRLGLRPVYVEHIYHGHEPFKIVGIREKTVELEGDFSGGVHGINRDWVKIKDCFLIKALCSEESSPNGCQIHNVHCCGGGSIIQKHVDKYWEDLI